MSVFQTLETFSGDFFLDSHGSPNGNFLGHLLLVPFNVVAAIADGVVVGTVQDRKYINRPFRVKGVYGLASAIAGATDPSYDVYTGATPATVLSAPVVLDTANAAYAGVVASPTVVHAAGIVSLRAITGATTGAITNLEVYLEIELIPA